MHIKIVRRPIGEAPDWVRDAWIGLSIPLVLEEERSWHSVGVLSGPRNLFLQIGALLMGKTEKVTGYVVNAKVAVDLLAATQPEAASWWRSEAPHVARGSYNFVFDAEACERETAAAN